MHNRFGRHLHVVECVQRGGATNSLVLRQYLLAAGGEVWLHFCRRDRCGWDTPSKHHCVPYMKRVQILRNPVQP